jgi:hypothetical protein
MTGGTTQCDCNHYQAPGYTRQDERGGRDQSTGVAGYRVYQHDGAASARYEIYPALVSGPR